MKKYKGQICLMLAAIIWGSAFIFQKMGMDHIGPFTFGVFRFGLGALALLPVIWIYGKANDKKPEESKKYITPWKDKELLMGGLLCGLASFIAGELGTKTRTIELSTLQRAASHCSSRVDILEAFAVGGAAVKAADEGDSGQMVVLQRISNDPYQCTTALKDVHKIANDEKCVPREWINKEGNYVTDEFINYVSPLIQGDVAPVMVNGIPRHLISPKELYQK